MATNNLMEAHSPIPWSTICDTAKETISASLGSEHSVKSIIEAASSANATAASSVSDARFAHAAPAARHTSRTRPMGGKHIRDLEKALPRMHTKRLHDQSFRQKPSILTQMRTGKCTLQSYLRRIGAEGLDLCEECGQREMVKHVLGCKRWTAERQELKAAMRDRSRWGDLPYSFGGLSGRMDPAGKWIDGEAATWKPYIRAVKALVEFAIEIGRFNTEQYNADKAYGKADGSEATQKRGEVGR